MHVVFDLRCVWFVWTDFEPQTINFGSKTNREMERKIKVEINKIACICHYAFKLFFNTYEWNVALAMLAW